MGIAFYRFDVEWLIDRPAAEVFAALVDLESYPRWWPDYAGFRRIDGDTVEFVLRAPMGYRLTVTNKWVERDPASGHFRLELGGDIIGWIDYRVLDEGPNRTRVDIVQECTAAGRFLRLLTPIAKPAFRYNHTLVMQHGLAALNELLPAER